MKEIQKRHFIWVESSSLSKTVQDQIGSKFGVYHLVPWLNTTKWSSIVHMPKMQNCVLRSLGKVWTSAKSVSKINFPVHTYKLHYDDFRWMTFSLNQTSLTVAHIVGCQMRTYIRWNEKFNLNRWKHRTKQSKTKQINK